MADHPDTKEQDPAEERPEDDLRRLLTLAKLDPQAPWTNVTKLNLPNCGLSSLPDGFAEAFPNLSILFLSQNNFREMPAVIGQCPALQMVAFKGNQMESIHPEALQPQLRWCILTNNALQKLPDTIGRCTKLQKFMLSGNQLSELPASIEHCQNLELIRLASNQLQEPPMTLLNIKSLKWVALSDNPFLHHVQPPSVSPTAVIDDIVEGDGDVLGQGAGGVTRRIEWKGAPVAVKEYSGLMTSDGLPAQERQISCAASSLCCRALIKVLGETSSGSLVMEYLDNFRALTNPPSMDSCSRDVYPEDKAPSLTASQAEVLINDLLEALHGLHKVGITHGDFYGHNILISNAESSNVRLSDFGAAFAYDKTSDYGKLIEQVELRAFVVLVEEVVALLKDESSPLLTALLEDCSSENMSTFDDIYVSWQQRRLVAISKEFHVEE